MPADYVDLCAHSWFSFGAGASSPAELVDAAAALDYPSLGLTDVSNLCGSLEFSRLCRAAGIQPILGADLEVRAGDAVERVTLIAENDEGYANLSRLVSLAYVQGGRLAPALDVRLLDSHSDGLIALLGHSRTS